MYKFNLDWFPTRKLRHNKVDIAALEAANERARHTQLRNKKKVAEVPSSASIELQTECDVNHQCVPTTATCEESVHTALDNTRARGTS